MSSSGFSGEHEPYVSKNKTIWRIYLWKVKTKKKNKKTNKKIPTQVHTVTVLSVCYVVSHGVQLRVNRTFVECDMFKRGNNLFSYYRKNRELYICICKRSLRTLSFLNRKYFTKAPQGNGRYSFFFIWFYFIYSICNYVMYRWGIEIK